jgi:hypothetical protein
LQLRISRQILNIEDLLAIASSVTINQRNLQLITTENYNKVNVNQNDQFKDEVFIEKKIADRLRSNSSFSVPSPHKMQMQRNNQVTWT